MFLWVAILFSCLNYLQFCWCQFFPLVSSSMSFWLIPLINGTLLSNIWKKWSWIMCLNSGFKRQKTSSNYVGSSSFEVQEQLKYNNNEFWPQEIVSVSLNSTFPTLPSYSESSVICWVSYLHSLLWHPCREQHCFSNSFWKSLSWVSLTWTRSHAQPSSQHWWFGWRAQGPVLEGGGGVGRG